MGRTLQIGQTANYWPRGATKPLAAICLDMNGEQATLACYTTTGGRFIKTVGPLNEPGGEGWTEVGQSVIG